tara:strand:- start:1184 stop:1369 length:186 start_codon:yes stop_codon:yes gene_type:complete
MPTRKTTRQATLESVSSMVGILKKEYPTIDEIQILDDDKLSRLNEAQLKGFVALGKLAIGA